MRIEHHRSVGRVDLELAAQPALGALAEQRPEHAVGDSGASATRGADVDRAHAHPGGLDRREHGHDRGRRCTGGCDDQHLRIHGGATLFTRLPGR